MEVKIIINTEDYNTQEAYDLIQEILLCSLKLAMYIKKFKAAEDE